MLYFVYTASGIWCTRYMLYLVYAVLGVCCTWCMLYLVYAVLGVCCTQCQFRIMPWRHREGWHRIVFCGDGRVEDEKRRDAGWRREQCEEYKRIWEIKGTTCLIALGRPHNHVITCLIRTYVCCMRDGTLTRTQNALSPSLSRYFAPSLLISLLLVLISTIT